MKNNQDDSWKVGGTPGFLGRGTCWLNWLIYMKPGPLDDLIPGFL